MFEPFIWMFKAKHFWNNFVKMFFLTACIFGCVLAVFFLAPSVLHGGNGSQILFLGLFVILVLFFLLIHGYFWELTFAIINRKADISANNVYSGRIKQVFTIEIPDLKIFKSVWRGFSSIIATVLMLSPYVLLTCYAVYSQNYFIPMQNAALYHGAYLISYKLIYILFLLFLPGFLWNYAKENSVFAGLNIVKAVYLLESYPLKYFTNLILFFVSYYVNYFIIYNSFRILFLTHQGQVGIGIFIIMIILFSFSYLYWLYFSAYVLGTLAPIEEI